MPNKKNVSAGKPKITGAVFKAPLGSTLPTTAAATLDAAFEELGYVSEDGVTNQNSASTENVRAWGGSVVLIVSTEKPDTFQFSLLETLRPAVPELVYGADNVTVTEDSGSVTGYSIAANDSQAEEYAYVIDMALRDGAMKRIVIPDAQLSELGDIVYRDSEATMYQVTLAAMPDAAGNTHYEYVAFAS